MQYHWLNKQNNDNLIIFFCGWSFDYIPFERLDCGNNDVLCVYDYSEIADNSCGVSAMTCPNENLQKSVIAHADARSEFCLGYKKFYLIAWSMGVYIAYLLRDSLPEFHKKIAINGTPFPVDDEKGIPKRTFDLTLKYVDTGLQGKFQQNLFKNPADYEKYLTSPVGRSIENRAAELAALDKFIKSQHIEYSNFYDCAIISDADKIIPTRNQIRCWDGLASVVMLDSGHFPFFEFNSWDEILDKCN